MRILLSIGHRNNICVKFSDLWNIFVEKLLQYQSRIKRNHNMSDHERIYLMIENKISNFNICLLLYIIDKKRYSKFLILIHVRLIDICIFQNNLIKRTRFNDNLILTGFKNNAFTKYHWHIAHPCFSLSFSMRLSFFKLKISSKVHTREYTHK